MSDRKTTSKPTNSCPKRSLSETSPELPAEGKKQKNKGEMDMEEMLKRLEVMLDNKLDEKLKNISTKEDMAKIQNEICALRKENVELRSEIQILKENEQRLMKKVEGLDKENKRTNILVSGLKAGGIDEVRQSFRKICVDVLEEEVRVGYVKKIGSTGSKWVMALPSPIDVNTLLSKSRMLKGTNIYLQRDYTQEERRQNYNLRRVKNSLKKQGEVVAKVIGTTLIIGEKKFKWAAEGHITATNKDEGKYLEDLLKANGVENFNVIASTEKHNINLK